MLKLNVFELTIKGVTPILLHNNQGVDPLNHYTKELKTYTSKRKKTEEDLSEISKLEYASSMYFKDDIGVYIPSICVEGTLRNAAKKFKRGADAKLGLFVNPDNIPLIYDGPKTIEDLFNTEGFRDTRVVSINRASILRCRPRFEKWELICNVEYDPEIFDLSTLRDIVNVAGKYIGLCDFRPKYGRFEAFIK